MTEQTFPKDVMDKAKEQYATLSTSAAQVVPEEGLVKMLAKSIATNSPLRVKFGADPTAPDIHLGHTVTLNKLRQFQDLGHTAVLLIGDYTARIGDPSGRNKTRPPLSGAEIDENAKTYAEQAFKILDRTKTEIVYNSEWLSKLSFEDMLKLLSQVTVSQILQREDFHERYSNNQPIAMHEMLYPIMQGYDSVAIKADVELGGTDQTFNCLMGRELQKTHDQAQQVVLTLPLLEGTDGVKKMSKSLGNYIGVNDEPNQMFGKVMSIPDELLGKYFELLTTIDASDVPAHPMEAKKLLARFIVTRFHDEAAAKAAQNDFETRFSKNQIPDDIPEKHLTGDTGLAALLVSVGFAQSNSEGMRLIKQNAVKIDGATVSDPRFQLSANGQTFVLQAGKRRIAKVTLNQ